jgi:hypothetical protein
VQRTLLTIAAAGDALVATFGVEQRALGSMFAVWASREVSQVLLWLIRFEGVRGQPVRVPVGIDALYVEACKSWLWPLRDVA